MTILVSACLTSIGCRYDGKIKEYPQILALAKDNILIPVCPEQLGGRPTPRNPVEILNGKVVDKNGNDHTAEFEKGAQYVLKTALLNNCNMAILKSKSPSCGFGKIYDGTFSKTLVDGNGITAQLLIENGIEIKTENDF
jgi:uncharacterized protein YbbK (DUF523 family)